MTTLLLLAFVTTAGMTAAQPGADDVAVDPAVAVGAPEGRPLAGRELETRTRALGSQMRCPVCQGLSIADSPATSATSMLAQVRDLLSKGYSEDQILDYFVGSYGEFVLLEPRARGFNLVVWLGPLIAVAIGLVLVLRRIRRRASAPAEREAESELADYLERVRSEVGR